MGVPVHTGVGYGAIRPSGRSVQPNGLTDICEIHGGQFAIVESLFGSGGSPRANEHIDYMVFTEGPIYPVPNVDSINEQVFASDSEGAKDYLNITDAGVIK